MISDSEYILLLLIHIHPSHQLNLTTNPLLTKQYLEWKDRGDRMIKGCTQSVYLRDCCLSRIHNVFMLFEKKRGKL